MIINHESYLQKCVAHHAPKYTHKFLSQTHREFISPPANQRLCTFVWNCLLVLKRGQLNLDPFSQSSLFFFFFSFKHQRRSVTDEGNRERPRVRCINQGVIWSALTFKISLSCLIAVGQSLLITFSCTECTARLTKWIGLFIRPWGPLEN